MSKFQLSQIISADLLEVAFNLPTQLTKSRDYLNRYASFTDAESNIVMVNNENYAAHLAFNYHNVKSVSPIIEYFEDTYSLDFSYYEKVLNEVNYLYQVTKFFDGLLMNPFKNNSWEQFKPTSRQRKFCEDFSRNVKLIHNPAGSKKSKMIMKHKIAIAKINLGGNTYEYIPIIKFALPMSRITSRTVFVSLSSRYKFMGYIHSGELIYVDDSSLENFLQKHHTSIITYVYNNIAKHIGMMDMSLKEFKQLDVNERGDFILVANMMKT